MTNAFRITNTTSGADLGIYCGETSADAIAAMLADARCSDAPGSDIVASIVSDADLFGMEAPSVPRRRLGVTDAHTQGRLLGMAIYEARDRIVQARPLVFGGMDA